jgi:hypothetical protein
MSAATATSNKENNKNSGNTGKEISRRKPESKWKKI